MCRARGAQKSRLIVRRYNLKWNTHLNTLLSRKTAYLRKTPLSHLHISKPPRIAHVFDYPLLFTLHSRPTAICIIEIQPCVCVYTRECLSGTCTYILPVFFALHKDLAQREREAVWGSWRVWSAWDFRCAVTRCLGFDENWIINSFGGLTRLCL